MKIRICLTPTFGRHQITERRFLGVINLTLQNRTNRFITTTGGNGYAHSGVGRPPTVLDSPNLSHSVCEPRVSVGGVCDKEVGNDNG